MLWTTPSFIKIGTRWSLRIKKKNINMEKVLITIHTDNIASQRVALANGGLITEKTDERIYIWIQIR